MSEWKISRQSIASAEGASAHSPHILKVHTPTGVLALVRTVAEKLLAEGIICGEIDKVLHAHDATTVKAAIMSHAVCDFCSAPGAITLFDIPDFELPDDIGTSVAGWMACDICAELIQKNNRKGLFDRTIEALAFPKFSRTMLAEMHSRFWRGMDVMGEAKGIAQGMYGFIEDKMLEARATVGPREKRIDATVRLSGLTRAEIEHIITNNDITPMLAKKLVAWRKTFGTKSQADVADLLNGGIKPPTPQNHIPHWQKALDARFGAMKLLESVMDERFAAAFNEATDMKNPAAVQRMIDRAEALKTLRNLGFRDDLKFLRAADSYSFNHETIEAITEAAKSIPHDSPLSAVETPNVGAGWFWFHDPLKVTASPASADETNALLWGWTNGERSYRMNLTSISDKISPELAARLQKRHGANATTEELNALGAEMKELGLTKEQFNSMWEEMERPPSLMFSAYVIDRGKSPLGPVSKGEPLPSTRWFWPIDMSYDEMLEYNSRSWDKSYGEGGKYAGAPNIVSREETMKCIGDLSLFFLAACVWFKQKIIIASPGHIERHARKRMVKEHKLKETPSVRVIALRASVKRGPAEPREPREGENPREYHYRWIVKGHPRLQVCGPGRRDRKLIWIDPYPKGPEDKPLRTREKVFAVIR